MACVINIRNLVNAPQNTDPFGFYEVIGVTFNGNNPLRFGRGGCPGTPVDINTGMSMAQVTDALFNVTGGQAHNDNLAANWILCVDDTENSTVQFRYTIERPGCPPEVGTFTIEIVDSCAYYENHNVHASCANPDIVTRNEMINLADANGVTNGVPWATILAQTGCSRSIGYNPATYNIEGGGTGQWSAAFNDGTGILTIPNNIKCGEPCVTITFTSNQPAATQCNDCDSSGTYAFLPPDTCVPSLGNGSFAWGYAETTQMMVAPIPTRVEFTLDGVPSSTGYYNVFFKSGAIWTVDSGQLLLLFNDLTNQIAGEQCAEGCVTLWAFAAPIDGPNGIFSLELRAYLCNSCGATLTEVEIQGVNQFPNNVGPWTNTCPAIPGGAVGYSNC